MSLLHTDPHRPRYHFLPPSNWMNDPNGLIYWQGRYHLFYQYNPNGPFWGTIHWGHAVSEDLVHWTDWPVALKPSSEGADQGGCWSGCAVNHDGVPTLIYSGEREGNQRACIATSTDGLWTWQSYAGNPVIPDTPAGFDINAYRDHCVWSEDEVWYQLIGAGIRGVGGTAFLYRSRDLHEWDYMHPLYTGDVNRTDPIWTGDMWECPDFFRLGDQYVLVISAFNYEDQKGLYTLYFTGTLANHRFTAEQVHKMDYGDVAFYAPQTFQDAQGRRIMFAWLVEQRSLEVQNANGWAGVMSLPRILTPRADGKVGVAPAPELAQLRGEHFQIDEMTLTPDTPNVLGAIPATIPGDSLELVAEFAVQVAAESATQLVLAVRCALAGEEKTTLTYNFATQILTIDRAQSSLADDVNRSALRGIVELLPDQRLRLHLFLDHSVLEVFANDWACFTTRIYPTRPDSLGLSLSVVGGAVTLKSLDLWALNTIWADAEIRTIPVA
ncbi:MAG: glycoside hydrolase family 32 protein [Anaerolineae bacterium]|nr:glycoside hydrolase family 32 protein [Anaerolineae bacterium]